MRTSSLLLVLLAAKILTIGDGRLWVSPWSPVAYLWQDLVVVLLFATVEIVSRRTRLMWGAYGAVVVLSAITVPLARATSTPLTWPMMRAARGAISDSVVAYLTVENLARIGVVLALGAALPPLLARCRFPAWRRTRAVGWALAILAILLGPAATRKVPTLGLHRNGITALAVTAFPRIGTSTTTRAWRESPFGGAATEDLSHLRAGAAGRHVVLVVLESTGASYLRAYGSDRDPMPGLTRLAGDSLLFENAYAVYPESVKGLLATLCSRYPAPYSAPEEYRQLRIPTLPAELATAGYTSLLFHSGRFSYLGMRSIVEHRGFEELMDAGDIGGVHDSSFGVDEMSTVDRILARVDARGEGERLFIAYLPIAGHHPYDSPDGGPFPGREEIDAYHNALHHADRAVTRLVSGFAERGLAQETMFVFVGDHGEAFGQHEGNHGHVFFLYEENVRVPLLIHAPGLWPGSTRVQRVASSLDLAPTILDLLGLPLPVEFQGGSLLEPSPAMALFFTDYALGQLGLRDGAWKYIHELETGRELLFDLSRDRGELQSVVTRHPQRADRYRRLLLEWAAAQRGSLSRPGSLIGPATR